MIPKAPTSPLESAPADCALFEPLPYPALPDNDSDFSRVMDETLNQQPGQSGISSAKSSQSDSRSVNEARRKLRDDGDKNKSDADPSAISAAASAPAQAQQVSDESDGASHLTSDNRNSATENGGNATDLKSAATDPKSSANSLILNAPNSANLASLLEAQGGTEPAQTAANSGTPGPVPAIPGSAAGSNSQVADLEHVEDLKNAIGPPSDGAGIGTALDSQRMKFDAQKDEIAGRGQQKLPRASAKSDSSSDAAGKSEIKSDAKLSELKKESSDPVIVNEPLPKSAPIAAARTGFVQPAAEASSSPQVERVAQMVSDEVVIVHQSGAANLAVSLKVDARTELFLQLSNHGGQIQASIRFERGNVSELSHHWPQLQESLARQNVQLLPLQEKSGARHSTQNPFSDNTDASRDGRPEQNEQRQTRNLPQETVAEKHAPKSARSRASKTKNPAAKGWESWA